MCTEVPQKGTFFYLSVKLIKMKKIIAIQGVKGAFHQEAAAEYFGNNIAIHECITFQQLIHSVESGDSHVGVMAVENSLVGSILPNYALIRESDLQVTGEVYLRIVQNLIAFMGESVDSIVEVRSHPMALAQCESFFKEHPEIRLIESDDTAMSAKQIAELRLKGIATVASRNAAREYGLEVIAPSIESNKENYTRFLVLEKKSAANIPFGANKASITFTAKHQPGSLLQILKPFAENEINLTMLQSLPIVGRRWEYIFHADLTFDSLAMFQKALERAKKHTSTLDILGIYQSHELLVQSEKFDRLVHYC
jgi:prephenate dehydratase